MNTSSIQIYLKKISPFFLLFTLSLGAFWPYIIGDARFIGDSDRLSHYLGYLFVSSNGLANGYFPIWNDSLFMGYSMVSTPYMFPNPLLFLESLPGMDPIYSAAIIACLLMFLESIFCFMFIRSLGINRMISLCGSVLYIFSSSSVLRISQNECTFYTILIAPLLFYLVNKSTKKECVYSSLSYQSLAIGFLLFTGSYQEIAYLLLVCGVYSIWLCYQLRIFTPTILLIASTFIGTFAALPRILTVGLDFSNSIRHYAQGTASNFEIVYRQVNTVSKNEILRLLDDRIFGLTLPEALKISRLDLNLHEGMLLYISSIAIFFLITYLFKYFFNIGKHKKTDLPIFLLICTACISVTLTKSGYFLMYKLFLDVDFMHGRVVLYSTIPLIASVCILLQDWIGRDAHPIKFVTYLFILILSAGLVAICELFAKKWNSPYLLNIFGVFDAINVYSGSLVRIIFSGALVSIILILAAILPKYKFRLGILLICSMMVQSTIYGFEQIKGTQLQTDNPPFLNPVRLMAKKIEFLTPTLNTKEALHNILDSKNFRTAIVCDRSITIMPCSTFIANFWGIDSPDGYISSIPERLSRLPWGDSMSLRYITFWTTDKLPWKLLGLLNVKYALVANKELLTNSVPIADQLGRYREMRPEDVTLLENPYPVTPKIFFTSKVIPVKNEEDAAKELTLNLNFNPIDVSIVEGLTKSEPISKEGTINIRRKGQNIFITVSPSKFVRFLVLNDRYEPNWYAYSNNEELKIYPTNLIMRGVYIPPGVTEISMQYRPLITRWWAPLFPIGAILLLIVILFLKRKGYFE